MMGKLLITGADSMIGRHIMARPELIHYNVVGVKKCDYDLTDQNQTNIMFMHHRPNYVVHLAGYNGGIEFNRRFGDIIYERTVRMAINVLSCARDYGVTKCLSVLASCSYPNSASDVPMVETDLWNGAPNPSVECHGSAKRVLDVYSRLLCATGKTIANTAIMNNSFGPYDRFDPLRGKVVSALIRRFVEATETNAEKVICWGTGAPLREFIYANDAAGYLIQIMENFHDWDTINVSSGSEISIKELTELIVEITGYKGKVEWDTSKPDGQMRKALDLTKMKQYVNISVTDMRLALTETINWYKKNKELADARK